MGGVGSGRWYRGSKDILEDCRSIDVHRWLREGLLRPGERFSWLWRNAHGRREASIRVECAGQSVRLRYAFGAGTSRARDIDYTVLLAWTPCHFGGARPWFVCPGRGCGRRVTKLHLWSDYFLCRHCHGLTYSCRGEARGYWLLRRAQRIRARLGGHTGLGYPFPDRPKRMHRRTYDRLRRGAYEAERAGHEAVDQSLAALAESLCRVLGVSPEAREGDTAGRAQ